MPLFFGPLAVFPKGPGWCVSPKGGPDECGPIVADRPACAHFRCRHCGDKRRGHLARPRCCCRVRVWRRKSGEPNVRQLEPHWRVAETAQGFATSRLKHQSGGHDGSRCWKAPRGRRAARTAVALNTPHSHPARHEPVDDHSAPATAITITRPSQSSISKPRNPSLLNVTLSGSMETKMAVPSRIARQRSCRRVRSRAALFDRRRQRWHRRQVGVPGLIHLAGQFRICAQPVLDQRPCAQLSLRPRDRPSRGP